MATGASSPATGEPRRIFRFGAFEFDPETGELRKHGMRLKLKGQPAGILAMLLERAGEVVTREELQKGLWAADTFVDFEHSLNAAVKRLRAALGDSADAPRFIETIPRQGYRFVAPFSQTSLAPSERASERLAESKPPLEIELPAPTAAANTRNTRRPWIYWAGAAALAVTLLSGYWAHRTEYFWRSPIADAQFQTVTDFDGTEQAAAISKDGHFVAFQSDRDGPVDIWVTQIGSGQFHNMTRGTAPETRNPSLRTLGFSPDDSLVTYWVRRPPGRSEDISVWAVPTLGGDPKPYLEGVAEYAWSRDGARLAYHTTGPGDPLYVTEGISRRGGHPIFTAPAGLHSHFPLWSPDGAFIYVVEGTLPDKMDIWRIPAAGGKPVRITSHNGRVSHPVLLRDGTLAYLAGNADGSGPWLYSIDPERRIPHRLSSGVDRYTSLAASADGSRLVLTRAKPKRTLWRLATGDSTAEVPESAHISLTNGTGFSPRLGPGYTIYASSAGLTESIWKLTNGVASELWKSPGARIIGGPAIAPDGSRIAFSFEQRGLKLLYMMASDGTGAQVICDSLDLRGGPAWTADGRALTSAAEDHGTPRLFRIPLDGRRPSVLVKEYALDPVWSSDGRVAVYSGPDIGTTFPLKAVTAEGAVFPIPALTLSRGARHMAFLPGGRKLVFLRGSIQHKDLWIVDLDTGAERRLTKLPQDFDIQDFDISKDGSEVILERVQDRSDIVLLDPVRSN